MSDQHTCQLYLVTPPEFDPAAFVPLVEEALAAGPVACFQVWLGDEDAPDAGRMKAAIHRLRDLVQGYDTAFVLNGHTQLAAESGCDGVHLNHASATEIKTARASLGADAIIGVSVGTSRHDAMIAGEAGADYVSFGPIFATQTKDLPEDPAALTAVEWWAQMMEIPCVAVGGITADNVVTPIKAGADFVCAIGSVWSHPDGPTEGVKALHTAIIGAERL